jgi:hypothetical protein
VSARLFVRRWILYAASCGAVFGVEVLFYTFVHVRMANFYAELIGSPLLSAIVLVNIGADATHGLPTAALRLERIIERAWAIIVIDVGITMLTRAGFISMSSTDAGQIFLGVIVIFMAAMLVYAEPFAAVENDVQTLTLVPFAVLRSMMLAWVNISRIFSLFAIQIGLTIVELQLLRWLAPKGGPKLDLIDLGFVTVITAPLAALFAVAYLDTLAQERRMRQR